MPVREFYNKRNKILIIRDTGGLGDILMMRMIFEDFKKLMPDSEITFAVPTNYHRALLWHPYIDKVVNSKEVDENDYIITYNLTSACVRYEMKIRPRADRHRAEIWSAHCGLELTKPDMHIHLPMNLVEYGRKKLQEVVGERGKGYVCFAPVSAMVSKNLDERQMRDILKGVYEMGYKPFVTHHEHIQGLNCPVIGRPLDEWLALINAADYVIAVDTAVFHATYGLGKPAVGIFSWACGKTYGKFHPKMVLVQRHRDHTPGWECGPCYAHPTCPRTQAPRKPCITEITGKEVIEAFATLVKRYPTDNFPACTLPPSSETSGRSRTDDTDLTGIQRSNRRILTFPLL